MLIFYNIQTNIDHDIYNGGVYVDIRTVFDVADYNIEHCVVRRISNHGLVPTLKKNDWLQ